MPTPRKLGLIAGAGDLPRKLVESCQQQGRAVHVVGLEGICDASALPGWGLSTQQFALAGMAQIGRIDNLLRDAGCEDVILAGTVRKPDFSSLAPDWEGIKLLPKVIAAARRGDDAILRVLIEHLEDIGFRVIGVADVAPSLLAPIGLIGGIGMSGHEADVDASLQAALDLGRRDAGQAAVARGGKVVALEDDAGTDAMLARIVAVSPRLGVLAKVVKPGQDRRADLPTIGIATIANAARAGLAGLVVEAGGALVLDRDGVARAADKAGVFVLGASPDHIVGLAGQSS